MTFFFLSHDCIHLIVSLMVVQVIVFQLAKCSAVVNLHLRT
jgi:hypothetical protein